MLLLTGYGFYDDGGMVVWVIARVEEMVVQCPVEPIVQELNGSYVKQGGDDGSLGTPHWYETDIWDGQVGHVAQ